MRRWKFSDLCAAGFYLAMAALFAWGFALRWSDSHCTPGGVEPCSLSDMAASRYDLPLTAGIAVACVILGLRVLWGMRHGE